MPINGNPDIKTSSPDWTIIVLSKDLEHQIDVCSLTFYGIFLDYFAFYYCLFYPECVNVISLGM